MEAEAGAVTYKADGVSDMADVAAAASDNEAMDGAEEIVGGEAAMAVILREIWLCVLGCSGIRAATGQEQTEKVTKK